MYLLAKFGGHKSSVLTWKKLNSPPRSAILRHFQNQEYGLTVRKSRTNTEEEHRQLQSDNFSAKKIFIVGVLQGSNHEPFLIHLFINDLAFVFTEAILSDYVDNNNLFSIGKDIGKIKALLAKYFGAVTNWFHENVMVLKSKKGHFMYWKKWGKQNIYI